MEQCYLSATLMILGDMEMEKLREKGSKTEKKKRKMQEKTQVLMKDCHPCHPIKKCVIMYFSHALYCFCFQTKLWWCYQKPGRGPHVRPQQVGRDPLVNRL